MNLFRRRPAVTPLREIIARPGSLTDLANRAGSDKGSACSFAHRYTDLYDLIFFPYRDRAIDFLELGLAVGGPETREGRVERKVASPSVAMWLDYFTAARIFGFDISDFSHIRHERFRFIRGDAGKIDDLERLAAAAAQFDIILDDASHASYHQQLAFRTLWPRLAPGGLYIIEDLHWQSPVFEAALPPVPLTRTLFPAWFEGGEPPAHPLFSTADYQRIADEVASFSAFPAFNTGADPSDRRLDGSAKLVVLRKSV
ncbi:class I SAM-dependent methyltransferase [Acidiphilium sp.]|uniref:class I SAM-dependent methyltransferase n=1 Tax=Acidiphilium sp. TaxID=527 RepID=UPI003D08C72C